MDVFKRQAELRSRRPHASLDDILTIPLATGVNWWPEEIQRELDSNGQGILGYVVRWIDRASAAPKCQISTTSA